jgi:nitroreductase
MKQLIDDLNWRYATKKFDPTRKIPAADIETLQQVLTLVPTSYGLQPYKFLIVENTDVREKLRALAFNQNQITEASHLLVLCSYVDLNDQHIDLLIQQMVTERRLDATRLQKYGDFIKSIIAPMSLAERSTWNAKQTYIALGQLLQTAANLRIDSTPMEGYDVKGYDEVLGLAEKNLTATVVCPLGYRAEDDWMQHEKKVRKPVSALFEVIQ